MKERLRHQVASRVEVVERRALRKLDGRCWLKGGGARRGVLVEVEHTRCFH